MKMTFFGTQTKYLVLFVLAATYCLCTLPAAAATNTQSIDFEKTTAQYAYISDVDQTGLDLSTTLTISAWIKLEAFTGSVADYVIAGKYKHFTNERSYRFKVFEPSGNPQSGKLEFNVSSDGTTNGGQMMNFRTNQNVIASDRWYHVSVTFDASTETAIFYVDGDVVSSSQYSGTTLGASIYNGTQDFVVGASVPAFEAFDGLIDEVLVWNVVRNVSQIEDDMVGTFSGSEPNLVGYWDFNGTGLDLTANGNHLTLVNGPVYSAEVPFDGEVGNEYPLYTQIESPYPSLLETAQWEDDTFAYGSQEWCGDTIGGCGCAITSGVMAGRNADITTDIIGNDVNPKNINEYLRNVGGYTSDGSVYWLAMQAYLGELTDDGRLASRFQYVGKYEGATAMSAVDQYLENEGEYAVLAFKSSLGHFIWLPAKTDDSYVVRDPFWYLTQTANDTTGADIKDYNDSFDSVRVFEISEEPVVASGSGVEAYLKGTAELIYKDATGSTVGYTSGGTVVNLPNSSYGNAEVIGLNGTPSPNAGGKHLLVSDASNEFTIEVVGTGSGDFEMEFFTISETGEVTTYTFSGQTIPGVTSTFTFNLETGEVTEQLISYEQFLGILNVQLEGYSLQQQKFFTKWAEKMFNDMEEKTVSQAIQSINVYKKLLVAKKIETPVISSVLDLLESGL